MSVPRAIGTRAARGLISISLLMIGKALLRKTANRRRSPQSTRKNGSV